MKSEKFFTLHYSLLILWLALTGSFAGWGVPLLVWINGLYSIALLILWVAQLWRSAVGGRRSAFKPLSAPLLAMWGVMALSSVINQTPQSLFRLYYLLALIALYHLPVNMAALRSGARLVGWILFPLVILLPWDNTNTLAMSVWSVYLLAVQPQAVSERSAVIFSGLAGLALVSTGSEGGMLAALAGAVYLFWRSGWRAEAHLGRIFSKWGLLLLLALAWMAALGTKLGSYGSLGVRVDMLRYAAANWRWLGHGADTWHFYAPALNWSTWDPHNLIALVSWEAGLPGLLIMIWLVYAVIRGRRSAVSNAWLVAFASHSLVDGVLYINFLSAVILMAVLGERYDNDATIHQSAGVWDWFYHWRNICGYRPGPAAAPAPSQRVDARAVHSPDNLAAG